MENQVKAVMAEMGIEPSLKAIAAALNVPQQRIYSVAKQAKAGEVYDPRVYNWDAIDRFILRRLDPDTLPTVQAVIEKAVELDKEFQTKDGRRAPRATTKAGISMADGTVMPARKVELAVGDRVMLKGETQPKVYGVAMLTDTHAVLALENSTVLACYSNWTMNQKLIPPARVDEVLAERLAQVPVEPAGATNAADAEE